MDLALSNISVMQILVFIAVADAKGFAKAANLLHITQPAVTKSIAKLEYDLEIKLFHRTTRSLELSECGRKLYDDWKPHLLAMQECFHATYASEHQDERTINIALINTTNPDAYFENHSKQFLQSYSFIELNTVKDSLENQRMFLTQHIYDIIFIPDFEHYELDRLHLPWKWVAKSDAQILVSKKHRLADRSSLTLDDIKEESFVIIDNSQNPNYLEFLNDLYRTQSFTPKIGKKYFSTNAIRTISKLDGILLTDDFFDYQNKQETCKIPLEDCQNGIICTWNEPFRTKYIRKFIEMIGK